MVSGGVMLFGRDHLLDFRASMMEDAWAEWATFYAFAGAALLFSVACWQWVRHRGWVPILTLSGLIVFCISVAGEEISWGQRLFAFQPPEMFMKLNYQQELNVHNLFKGKELWDIPLDTKYLVVYVCIVYGLIMPLAAYCVGRALGERLFFGTASPYLLPWFAAVALAELTYPVSLTGEAAELLLGTLFLADALLRLTANAPAMRSGLCSAMVLALPLILGAATPPVVEAAVYGSARELATQTEAELELLGSDALTPGTLGAKFLTKGRVHLRLFTAMQRGYLRFGHQSRFLEYRVSPAEEGLENPRRDRRGYLLDPWNNSYWINYDRNARTVLLYSFGPNRRRDTDLREMSAEDQRAGRLVGDDIAVSVPLHQAEGRSRPSGDD